MIEIKLTKDAYIGTGDYRMSNEDGSQTPFVLESDKYYEANAEDKNGKEYMVYWGLKDNYDPDIMEEDSACDWDNPTYVEDEEGCDVTKKVEVIL